MAFSCSFFPMEAVRFDYNPWIGYEPKRSLYRRAARYFAVRFPEWVSED